jgi:flagellar biogenesis protein FliO
MRLVAPLLLLVASRAYAGDEKPALDLSSVPKHSSASLGLDAQNNAGGAEAGWIAALLIAGGSAALIFWSKKRANRTSGQELMQILAERPVGPKTRLVLVEAKGREILLSVSDKGAERILDWWSDDARGDTADLERTSEEPKKAAVAPAAIPEMPAFLTTPDSEVVSGIHKLKFEKTNPNINRDEILRALGNRVIPEMSRRVR